MFTPPGSPERSEACIDGWMDGWMGDGWMGDGWVGKDLFLFSLFLENYLINDANCFEAP